LAVAVPWSEMEASTMDENDSYSNNGGHAWQGRRIEKNEKGLALGLEKWKRFGARFRKRHIL